MGRRGGEDGGCGGEEREMKEKIPKKDYADYGGQRSPNTSYQLVAYASPSKTRCVGLVNDMPTYISESDMDALKHIGQVGILKYRMYYEEMGRRLETIRELA